MNPRFFRPYSRPTAPDDTVCCNLSPHVGHGNIGASIATVAAMIPVPPLGAVKIPSILEWHLKTALRPLAYPVICTTIMILALVVMKMSLPGPWAAPAFVLAVLAAAICYAGVTVLLQASSVSEIRRSAMSLTYR